MKNLDSNFVLALSQARDRGLVPRQLLYITAKEIATGDPAEIGYWTGDEDISVTVVSGITGSMVTRTYYGGVNLKLPVVPRVSDLTIQTLAIDISAIAPVVQESLRGYDLRLARCEIHDALLDIKSRKFISNPHISFLGEIDGAPINTGSVGQASMSKLKTVSDAISMLTRVNPKKSSYQAQKRRNDDYFGKYSSTIKTWRIPWGQKK